MKLLIYLLTLLLITTNSWCWELKKDSSGIKVYTQDIKGSSFKAFRGETVISAPLKLIVSNHLNVETMSEWLQDCSASELLTKLSEQEFLVYQRTDAPWPVSDRDYVMKASIEQDPKTFVVTMRFEAHTGASKHSDECIQVTQLTGFWRFTPDSNNKVFVEYETHADPSGQIPAWLANSFVVDQPYGTLKKLKKRIENNDTKLVEVPFIREPNFE